MNLSTVNNVLNRTRVQIGLKHLWLVLSTHLKAFLKEERKNKPFIAKARVSPVNSGPGFESRLMFLGAGTKKKKPSLTGLLRAKLVPPPLGEDWPLTYNMKYTFLGPTPRAKPEKSYLVIPHSLHKNNKLCLNKWNPLQFLMEQ